ncbi:MAG: ATP-dependent DNA helicase RecG [Henriciella sp.]|nr:ATP-dependent DNA helicase RecG [Henriciella sp.]
MRDERLFPLFQSLDALPGIGPKLKPALEHLVEGETVWDLLLHMPERWLDRRPVDSFENLEPGEVATVRGEVHAVKAPYNDRAPTRIEMYDGTGFLTVTYFRADPRWLQGQFPIGKERIISDRVDEYKGERQMSHPDYVLDPAKGELPPPVEPIYPLTAGLTNKRVHSTVKAALDLVPADLSEWTDPALVAREKWPGFRDALIGIHAPGEWDEDQFALCRTRLAYDEALARELTFARARAARTRTQAYSIPLAPDALNFLVKSLPFKPTKAQIRATKEIMSDLAEPHPMRRMLQGDVGSGKTLVGAFSAVQTAAGGFQTAFMAPTEVLARQQYETLNTLLSPLGYTVAVLTGRDKGKAREATLMALADGSVQIIAGTQALFQEGVSYRKLGLVIVDEQHRFGVADRMRLAGKGEAPHVLVMSATPIPRTLAQSIQGDLELSVLDEKPAGRQPVETRAIPDSRIEDVIEATGRALKRGERAFWVCPRVDVDDEDGSSAVARAAMLRDVLGVPVGLVHGRLKGEEKDTALEDFRTGRTKLLVATTVIEVGVDVAEATIMVIERAEGFGLAQLHQLRGRVGRGDKPSFCLLLFRAPLTEMARERLDTLRHTEDGFEIAEADFKLRGPGDLLGKRQSGLINYRLIDLAIHGDLIPIARQDARLAIEKADAMTPERAAALAVLSQLLSPDLSFSD